MKAFTLYASDSSSSSGEWGHGVGRGIAEPADYCSREGAQALKEKIEAYWRDRGQDVMLSLHNVGFHPAIRAARFDVRSDMVNGLPRATLSAAPAHGNGPQRDSYTVGLADSDADDDNDHWID